MSIEKDIQKLLDESNKIEVEGLEEEALKPEAGTEEPNVKRANGKQTVSQKGVATGVDNEKPTDNDQSKETPAASSTGSENVSFGDNPKPTGGHDQSKDRMESVDVSADVEALVNGEELSEEFKTKAATIFEAAVVTRVKEGLAKIQESFDNRLEEEVEVIKQGLVEKVDGYLNYIVEQWISDNEVALTHSVKVEVMENFLQGMKTLFTENYVEIPEEKFDVVSEMEARLADVEAKLVEATEVNEELTRQINEAKRDEIVTESCEGLSEASVDKFKTLASELVFEDEETFRTKLKTIKENYFVKTKPLTESLETVVTDTPVLEESVETKKLDPTIATYASVLNKSKRG